MELKHVVFSFVLKLISNKTTVITIRRPKNSLPISGKLWIPGYAGDNLKQL